MKTLPAILFFVVFFLPISMLHAQSPLPTQHCGTMYVDSIRRSLNPSLGQFNYTQYDNSVSPLSVGTQTNGVITIPVIFHVVHYGEAVGNGRNLSQAQVNSQITVMNEDFRRMYGTPGWNNHPDGADIEIEFCAAIVDPEGNYLEEPGIIRHDGHNYIAWEPPYDVYDVDTYIKPEVYWDPNRFYNIYTVDIMDWGGYSQFPDSSGLQGLADVGGDAETDGFQLYYKYCGRYPDNPFENDFNMGRIASHEMGHALGLRHAWGDTGGCQGTDYCDDTPTCDAPGNYQANTSCDHPFECDNYRMIENYMDYSLDHCLSTFTQDQKDRMRHVMDVSPRRRTLPFSDACHAAPNCNGISFSPEQIDENNIVQFTAPYDGGYATTYQWYFEGGSPASSTDADPVVTYAQYGVYDVTIIITNQFGTCSMTHEGYITVYPDNPCDSLGFPSAGSENLYIESGGYACGWNGAQDKSKANHFLSPAPYAAITGGLIHIAEADDNGNGAYVLYRIWNDDGVNGAPGTVVSEKIVTLAEIETVLPGGGYFNVLFNDPVAVNGNFYFGFSMYNFGNGDSLGLYSNSDGDTSPSATWEQLHNGSWQSFSDARQLEISMHVFPFVTMDSAHAAISQPVYGCADAHLQFFADSSSSVSFSWNFPGASPSTSTSSAPVVEYDQPGEYKIYLSVVGAGCNTLDRDSSTIIIHGNPSVAFSTQEPACYGENDAEANIAIITHGIDSAYINPGDPIGTYVSLFDELFIPHSQWVGQNVSFPWYNSVAGLAAGDYTIIAVNAYGCVNEVMFTIGQPDEISVVVNSTPSTCPANPNGIASVSVSGGTPPYTYSWDDPQQQSSPTAIDLSPGVYEVVIVDSNGCVHVQSVTVPVGTSACVQTNVTRMLSPDGDGENDTWTITGLEEHPDAVVRVYDALGREVFYSVGYTQPWNGTMNENELPGGVYYYTISFADVRETGTVMLVK